MHLRIRERLHKVVACCRRSTELANDDGPLTPKFVRRDQRRSHGPRTSADHWRRRCTYTWIMPLASSLTGLCAIRKHGSQVTRTFQSMLFLYAHMMTKRACLNFYNMLFCKPDCRGISDYFVTQYKRIIPPLHFSSLLLNCLSYSSTLHLPLC